MTLPKDDSFDEKNDGPYVRRDRRAVRQFFDLRVISMGQDINNQEYCTCAHRPAIVMETFHDDVDSPLVCCGCGKPIPLYELPFFQDRDTYYEILGWQDNFSAMDILWTRCLCDRYTGKQLVDPDSALNRQGITLARDMEGKLGIKVYYNLFDNGCKKVKFVAVGDRLCRVCPKCGETMKYKKYSDDVELDICDSCSLSGDC